MKTTAYGIACVMAGMLLQKYVNNWPLLFWFVTTVIVGIAIGVTGMVLEALTINRSLWGEDRYER